MFILKDNYLENKYTQEKVHLEKNLGTYSTKYFYVFPGRGKISFYEEVNKTYLRREEIVLYKDLPEKLQVILLEVLNSYDEERERRRNFWL